MNWLERVELDALRDLAAAGGGCAVGREIGGAFCLGVPAAPSSRMLNHVAGLGLVHEATDDVLDRIAGFYGGMGVLHGVSLPPGARPTDLGSRLERRGYERGYAWMKFSRSVARPPSLRTELRIEDAGAEDGPAFGRVVAVAFELDASVAALLEVLPGRRSWHCFLAWDGTEAVAAGGLFAGHRFGWCSFGATLPTHRGRGAQSALLAARIRRAAELGLEALATETGERVPGRIDASYRNILRAGFAEEYVRPNYSGGAELTVARGADSVTDTSA